ncbi:lantibiotic dehydratase [Zobellia russellii]|uniref:lantibiotic dehydratase n=1 Tax=Zobellia russellii TaxID=248907 RepID=UPI0037DD287B
MQDISFLPKVILRSPLIPSETDITYEKITKKLTNSEIQEALFIASPVFYNLLKEDLTEKQLLTLYKYYSRFSNRCTPFGLFASVGVINISSETNIDIDQTGMRKHVRYDMLFLGLLNDQINNNLEIRKRLRYFPNNSLYQNMDNFRYVEFYYTNDKRFHRLAEVSHNQYLDEILLNSKNGATIDELCSSLTDDSISFEEANEFILNIIDAQFLVSEFDITLTGPDYLDSIIKTFEQTRFSFPEGELIRNNLNFLKLELTKLETKNTEPQDYSILFGNIKDLIKDNNLQLNRLFQIDTFKDLTNSTLSNDTLKKLRKGMYALNKLYHKPKNQKLEKFKSEFVNRYGHEMMSLCDVLDPDSGINYINISQAKTPLLNEIPLSAKNSNNRKISYSSRDEFLLKKVIFSYQKNVKSIKLKSEELDSFKEDIQLYPDTFSVLFSLLTNNEEQKIDIKSISGPSANNLIGRFSYLHEDILNISKEICELEQINHSDALIAEIVHLPEARTGNILYRKYQRDYEIPYLAKSSLPLENQILITDLYVTVKNDKVKLYSKTYGKEVIPRLGNAHNYSFMALPVYNFLCDIQNQYSSGFAFNWGELGMSFPFLPRLEYENCILSKAQWNLTKKDINKLLLNKNATETDVKNFAKDYTLPQLVVFTEGDNEVLINFKNDLSCQVFLALLKNKKTVILQEYLMSNLSDTKGYANEFLAFGNNVKQKHSVDSRSNHSISINQSSTNQDWIFFKLYCGPSTAEEVLKEVVTPALKILKSTSIIKKWFFIRYNDTDGHHLRLRVKLYHNEKNSEVFSIIQNHIKPFKNSKTVWKFQTENYLPEYERYGFEIMEETETTFQNDSDCTLAFLHLIEGDEGEKIRWLFSLLSIDYYLNDFKLTDTEKLALMQSLKDGFGSEFNKDKSANKKINIFFKEHENEISDIIEVQEPNHIYFPLLKLVKNRSSQSKQAIGSINKYLKKHQIKRHQIIGSHIHMICNRIFITKQREQEAIIYDLLYQHYKRKSYRKK